MNYQETKALIHKAIQEKRTLRIRQKDTTFDIEFEPYLQGTDFLQHTFVWGYIPFNDMYYKFYFEFAEHINASNKKFNPPDTLNYYFSNEEEHYAFLDSIKFWRNFGNHS